VELHAELPQPGTRGRAAAALGLASAALLYSAFQWAHHWNPLADSIVATWALATVAALVVSTWSLLTTRASRRLAKLGLALALLSLLALALAGLVFAAGLDPAGACGGG
jgi:hypothetical membrane protein